MSGLPKLVWVASPNFSARTSHVDQIIIHDTEGAYLGAVSWFANPQSQVSAHFVVKEDGTEATQMVHLADKAWHACAFNSRSVGVELAGSERRGYDESQLEAAAAIVAYLCHNLHVPVQHARGGVGPGIASHFDLGKAGGGHNDPSMDPEWMPSFVARVEKATALGIPNVWDVNGGTPCRLAPPV